MKDDVFKELYKNLDRLTPEQAREMLDRLAQTAAAKDRAELAEIVRRNGWSARDVSRILAEAGIIRPRGRPPADPTTPTRKP